MKRFIIFCIFLAVFVPDILSQQNPQIYQGKLNVNSMQLTLVFRIFSQGDSLKGFLDSPDQGANDIPLSKVLKTDTSILFEVKSIGGYYEGKPAADSIIGIWYQGGSTFPLVLKKVAKVEGPKRPQTPVAPYPYNEEEVFFKNDEQNLTLAGTFTWSKTGSDFPAVVLVTGSGRQDRDETIFEHKPFMVLADYLTRQGIAVLRYDDRGAGKSGGDYSKSNTEDFTTDALAAVKYLMTRKEVDHNKIGIAGHSEGGLIAPIASLKSKDVSYIVLMAGPGIKGDSLLLLQAELLARAQSIPEEQIKKNLEFSASIYKLLAPPLDSAGLKNLLENIITEQYNEVPQQQRQNLPSVGTVANQQFKTITSPWFTFFVNYDPVPVLEKIKIPVLAINGEKDLQVPPKENLPAIEKALKKAGNKNYKTEELPGLNHLFQECKTGAISEYGQIEQTFSPKAMEVIADWIKKVTK